MSDIEHRYQQISELYIGIFEKRWRLLIDTLPYDQIQLRIGNRLRPLIVYGGYTVGKSDLRLSEGEYAAVADIAISVELVHKASLLLDDWIDKDNARHGEKAFHTEYTPEEAVMFSMQIVGVALRNLSERIKSFDEEHPLALYGMDTLLTTVINMSQGEIEELTLTDASRYDIPTLKRITALETSEIITTGLTLGYYAGDGDDPVILQKLHDIGRQCGYIFQLMNDMEPFCHLEKNTLYKGNKNIDVLRSRKNLVVAHIYRLLSSDERRGLAGRRDEVEITSLLHHYFHHYTLRDSLLDEVTAVNENIHRDTAFVQEQGASPEWNAMFDLFIDGIVARCKERLE
jgi:heptaprenyl diphosphate synthase